jgi:hypothetical protein
VRFEFPDVDSSQRNWWLVIMPDNVDVCDEDPGHPVTLEVRVGTAHDDPDLAR